MGASVKHGLAAATIFAACSCVVGHHHAPPMDGRMMGPVRSQLVFVSPMGEPFRVANAGDSPLDLWFNSADTSHDGALSEAEFRADALRYFERLDTNGDQSATSVESTAVYRREAPEVLSAPSVAFGGPPPMGEGGSPRRGGGRPGGGPPGGGGGPGGGPPGGGGGPGGPSGGGPIDQTGGMPARRPATMPQMPQGAQRFGLLGDAEPVMSCDSDMSRRVTRDEFETCITERFAALDSDHDALFQRREARLWRSRASPERREL